MLKAGVIGLGDMGSGLAKNLIQNGFATSGFDLDNKRMQAFTDFGGDTKSSVADVAQASDVVFVMVMNGDQAKYVILGENGLIDNMSPGSCIILTATIKPMEAEDIATAMQEHSIALIDSPVSGGFPGAQGGTLTMMAAGKDDDMAKFKPVMEAVSSNIHHVGEAAPKGQIVKACLQSVIGSIFAANYEAAVLAAKAGVTGEVLYNVFSTSGAGCGITNTSIEHIINRNFEGTGSHISTMHKDLTISLNMAENLGIPLHMAANAMQIFHAGKTKYPNGDNQACAKVLEEIVGVELHR